MVSIVILLVCGGRAYADRARVHAALDALHQAHPVTLLIHGGAAGADSLALGWATLRHVSHRTYPAEWNRYGRRAGMLRNQRMLNEGRPDLILAFPGGSGTADMVQRGLAAGVLTLTVG